MLGEESWQRKCGRNDGRGIMEEESFERHHGRGIMGEESCERNQGGGIMEESGRRNNDSERHLRSIGEASESIPVASVWRKHPRAVWRPELIKVDSISNSMHKFL